MLFTVSGRRPPLTAGPLLTESAAPLFGESLAPSWVDREKRASASGHSWSDPGWTGHSSLPHQDGGSRPISYSLELGLRDSHNSLRILEIGSDSTWRPGQPYSMHTQKKEDNDFAEKETEEENQRRGWGWGGVQG